MPGAHKCTVEAVCTEKQKNKQTKKKLVSIQKEGF